MSTYMDIVSNFTFHFRYSIVLPNNNYLIWIINLDEGNNYVVSPTTNFSCVITHYYILLFIGVIWKAIGANWHLRLRLLKVRFFTKFTI